MAQPYLVQLPLQRSHLLCSADARLLGALRIRQPRLQGSYLCLSVRQLECCGGSLVLELLSTMQTTEIV